MSESTEFMQTPVCCGADVHKKSIVACLITTDDSGKVRRIHKKFSTMTRDIENFRDWLLSYGCTQVAMESTGVYWKPLFNILEESQIKTVLANARHVKNLPGKKTDMSDAEWLATLLRNGLIRGSFIPPKNIRELRDLVRCRAKMVQDQTRIKNRIQKLLEDANIKLASVASDIFGVSGMDMLNKLAYGDEVIPSDIALLARGKLKKKRDELTEAAYGRLAEHHRIILRHLLSQLSYMESAIESIEALMRIKVEPYTKQIELLDTIPGVDWILSVAIIAEIGVDMSVFPTEKHISSWAGVCPGNNESAGKHRSGKIPPGNRYLKAVLCQGAWAASKKKKTYLSKKFWSLKIRRGDKKAVTAIAHKILVAAFHILRDMEPYRELGPEYLDNLKGTRMISRMIRELKERGYAVTAPAGTA